jgi:L-threonylcarbamoyladenylate synthase
MIGKDLMYAANELKLGNLVAIPTETVYGLAANAFDKDAVLKIFEAKNRPFFDPLILHTDSIEKLEQLALNIPDKLMLLSRQFMPGPLTLLLPKRKNIPDIVTSGLPNVAVRIPNHTIALELLSMLDFPIAAPSANPFGYVSPTKAKHVEHQLGEKINYILDGGDCEIGIESTIVGMEDGVVTVYRLGGLAIEEIEKFVGKVSINLNQSSNPAAPGMLKSHYAPKKQLFIDDVEMFCKDNSNKKIGIISLQKEYKLQNTIELRLSVTGNLHEAAHNLFSSLRYFDETDVDVVVAEKFPESFLGRAINDRLYRASAK